MKNIAIFASGSGTNAENIINHFSGSNSVKVALILSNKPDAFVLERAKKHNIESIVFNREDFYKSSRVLDLLKAHQIDYIVLAGFLWLVPQELIDTYRNRIINVHPALLPCYGGKGMYGDNVHRAVVAAGESQSGITIHLVNEMYDSGDILLQARVGIKSDDTPETLAQKVHKLEYKYFPIVIESELENL